MTGFINPLINTFTKMLQIGDASPLVNDDESTLSEAGSTIAPSAVPSIS